MTTVKKRGRPSLFRPEYIEQAEKLAMLGMTNEEMTKFFEVAKATFDKWMREIDEFSSAVKKGRAGADAEVVASLYKRAIGYSHPAVKIMQYEGRPVTVEYTERYPPDPVSMIFWLRNRQPAKWRNNPDAATDDTPPAPVKIEIGVKNARVRETDD